MTNFRTFSSNSARIIAGFAFVANAGIANLGANEGRVYPRSCDTYICAYHHQYTPQQYAPQTQRYAPQTRRHLPSKIALPTMPRAIYPSYPSYPSYNKVAPSYAPQPKSSILKIETDMLLSFEPEPIPTPAIVPQPAPLEITDEPFVESDNEPMGESVSESTSQTPSESVAKQTHKPKNIHRFKSLPKAYGIGVGSGTAKGYVCDYGDCAYNKPPNETGALKSKPQPKSWIDEMQLNDVPSRF